MAPTAAILLGAILVFAGGHQVWLGWKKRPLKSVSIPAEALISSKKSEPAQESVFRLQFDHGLQCWEFLDNTGAGVAQLPASFPQASVWQPPERAMSLQGWREYFSEALKNLSLNLNTQGRIQLAELSIAGEKPFTSLASGASEPIETTISEPSNASLPLGFDPRSPLFEQHMRDWRRQNLSLLQDAALTREGYVFKGVHPYLGKDAPLVISSAARKRILSADFGRKRQDLLIYLQALCNHHMIFLKIDGTSGPQTRQSVEKLATIISPDQKSSANYLRQLQPWIAN